MDQLPDKAECGVAVLPFVDRGHFPNGADLFYKVLTGQLVSEADIQLVNEGDIRRIYNQLRIFPTQMPLC